MSYRHLIAVVALVLLARPAEARFGKAGSSPGASSPSPSGGSRPSVPPPPPGAPSAWPRYVGPSLLVPSPWRYGYYSGFYVPWYGYGYGYYAGPPMVANEPLTDEDAVAMEPTRLRVSGDLEAMPYAVLERGVTFGVQLRVEGERWGAVLAGQAMVVRSLEDAASQDALAQAQARITYAFLTGRRGRLRAELGGDAVFAQNLTVAAPSAALSGTLWLVGPLAMEAQALVTLWPFRQYDARAGLAVGLGPVGLRAGWRVQVLDDRGLTGDGIIHRDIFTGPYLGASLVF